MRHSPRLHTPLIALAVSVCLGVALGTLWSAHASDAGVPNGLDTSGAGALEAVSALPRSGLMLAVQRARSDLAADHPWKAWNELRGHVEGNDAPASVVLLAARAAEGWEGWGEARDVLSGRSWLDTEEGGEGRLLLARALENTGDGNGAIEAYRRFVDVGSGGSRGTARMRLARLLLNEQRYGEAADALNAAATDLPAIQDWLGTLRVEALASGGDSRLNQVEDHPGGSSPTVRARRARSLATARISASDTAAALNVLNREVRSLRGAGASAEAATLDVLRAQLLASRGRLSEARGLLIRVARDATGIATIRAEAADLLGDIVTNPSAPEHLARADGYEAAGRNADAGRAIDAAIAAGAADDGSLSLRSGMLRWEARDYGPARVALRSAEERLVDRGQAARAALHAARAQYRAGDATGGTSALRSVVERYPNTAAAGTALFLLGDLENSIARAIQYYRRASIIGASAEAREAHYRLGDRLLARGDTDAALATWGEFVARHPRGEQTAQAAFRIGLAEERRGRTPQAHAAFNIAVHAHPLSYYAVQAGSRIERSGLQEVLETPSPWPGLAADPVDARTVVTRLRLLSEGGFEEAWRVELASAERDFRDRPAALLVLAEGLIERRRVTEAMRIGRQLARAHPDRYDARLLRIVYPLPWREVLLRAADRSEVDPMLFAGLVHQESMWQPRVSSWVGAAGLAQIMPTTGEWLAPQVGIEEYRREMLEMPEVSLRMGAFYLSSLLRRYDGHEDLALAGYNAGPSRADRWRGSLGHARDQDAFRDRIPFDETNHYVKIVLRNQAVYRQLYGQ